MIECLNEVFIYLEPIDGAAVDECGEAPESIPECISNGTHRQTHVQVRLDALNEVVVHGQGSGVNLLTLSKQ